MHTATATAFCTTFLHEPSALALGWRVTPGRRCGGAAPQAGRRCRSRTSSSRPAADGAAGPSAASSSFSILRFAEPELPDVVDTELLTTPLSLEKCGEVDHYMEVINRLSTQALTPDRTARFLNEITRET